MKTINRRFALFFSIQLIMHMLCVDDGMALNNYACRRGSLAPQRLLEGQDGQDRAAAKGVVSIIEDNPAVPAGRISLPAVARLLEKNEPWLYGNGMEQEAICDSDGRLREVVVKSPNRFAIRYYDPINPLSNIGPFQDSNPSATVKLNPWLSRDVYVYSDTHFNPLPLPEVNYNVTFFSNKAQKEVSIQIETLKEGEVKAAAAVHRESWKGNFDISDDEVHEMFSCNPGGHLVARDTDDNSIVAVIWCVSHYAGSLVTMPNSLTSVRGTRRSRRDNVWLHYAVGTLKKYRDMGLGPKIASELLKSTKSLSRGMTRGTYSPISGYGKDGNNDKYSPSAYLLTELEPAEEGQDTRNYLDYDYTDPDGTDTFGKYLDDKGIDRMQFGWQDYMNYSGGIPERSIEYYIAKSKRKLKCTAANMHVRNGAKIMLVKEGGREGDGDAGQCAFISIYQDPPGLTGKRGVLLRERIEADPDGFAGRSVSVNGKLPAESVDSGIDPARDQSKSAEESFLYPIHKEALPEIRALGAERRSRVLLSSRLFSDIDGSQLGNWLRINGVDNIRIMDPGEIRNIATNNESQRRVSMSDLTVVLTEDEFNNDKIWSDSDKKTRLSSNVLLLKDSMADGNYLYLEAVIGLAAAIMHKNDNAARALYSAITGTDLDPEALSCVHDETARAFIFPAFHFKPIEPRDMEDLERLKAAAEIFLASA